MEDFNEKAQFQLFIQLYENSKPKGNEYMILIHI